MSEFYTKRKGYLRTIRHKRTAPSYHYKEFFQDFINGRNANYMIYHCKNYKIYCKDEIAVELNGENIILYLNPTYKNLLQRFGLFQISKDGERVWDNCNEDQKTYSINYKKWLTERI